MMQRRGHDRLIIMIIYRYYYHRRYLRFLLYNGSVYFRRKADNNLHKSEIHNIICNHMAQENNGNQVC